MCRFGIDVFARNPRGRILQNTYGDRQIHPDESLQLLSRPDRPQARRTTPRRATPPRSRGPPDGIDSARRPRGRPSRIRRGCKARAITGCAGRGRREKRIARAGGCRPPLRNAPRGTGAVAAFRAISRTRPARPRCTFAAHAFSGQGRPRRGDSRH